LTGVAKTGGSCPGEGTCPPIVCRWEYIAPLATDADDTREIIVPFASAAENSMWSYVTYDEAPNEPLALTQPAG